MARAPSPRKHPRSDDALVVVRCTGRVALVATVTRHPLPSIHYHIAHAIAAGASGAFMKTADDADIIVGVRAVATGEKVVSDEIRQLLEDDPPVQELTERQLEILDYVTRGFTNQDIARNLGIRESSIKEHLMGIFGKIGASNRAEAVGIALRKQILKI